MKNKRLYFAIAASLACVALLVGFTLAYFTDNAAVSKTATAGTVKIAIDDSGLDLKSPDGLDNFNPGDGRLIVAPITNMGNKSVDVRQTFKVTMVPTATTAFTALPNDATKPMGWAIYAKSDCTQDSFGNWVVGSSATPIATPVITKNADDSITATYVISTDVVLNGTGAQAELETGGLTSAGDDYVLAMLADSDNSYQGATVTLDILAEAKQHRNNVAWTNLATATASVGGGSATATVVPAQSQDYTGTDF